jgi:ribonuclease PH
MSSTLRRTDLLALSNLRNDGRKPHEIRRMRIQMGVSGGKSALVEMGLTAVLAKVEGPMECSRRSEEVADRYVPP